MSKICSNEGTLVFKRVLLNQALRAKVQVFDNVMNFIKEKLPEAFLRVLETFKDEIIPVDRTKQMKEKAKSKEIDLN